MRCCLAYDCLYPWTVGGAELWYRNLAERLAADGHEVTYLTRLQWDPADPPQIPGVRVIAVARADELYGADGARRTGPPLRFGAGMLRHLWRHGREYDVVHLCSFPYFSVLAAAAARRHGRYRLVIDWFELWTREYWLRYLGAVGGRVGYAVQQRCVRVRHRAFCFSRLHRDRLVAEGFRGEPTLLAGLLSAGVVGTDAPRAANRTVLYAGRHIAEKRVPAVVAAIAELRRRGSDVGGLILGDGPERPAVLAAIDAHGLTGIVSAPGFVSREEVDDAMARALCLVQPSEREGYGIVVVEAAAHGTPVIVAAGPDNAAMELIDPGVNGFVAPSAGASDLADAIAAVDAGGLPLRTQSAAWFAANAPTLSVEASLAAVLAAHRA